MTDEGLATWLGRLATAGPDPGGGAAAAVMLGLGAALAEMVAGYPARPGAEPVTDVGPAARGLRDRALDLVARDAAASARLVAAWRSGGADLADAAVAAAGTSAEVVDVATDAVPLLARLLTDGNPPLVADVAVAAAALAAAARSGAVNLAGNLGTAAEAGADDAVLAPLRRRLGDAVAAGVRLDDLHARAAAAAAAPDERP
ncbi:cyclodeaminase/cyclohydrolase family protein [Nocardioides sp. SOB77]|uniref:Cyclodeaminase/cyclohydrolase family protein n=1 Tax=Nocardioides oceani TaxID=3058369 RepID=A0ABT8FKD8_9ACTN|nr:cyclodeaminase/cyclohydrolase family protein [Nocardioides oceani]MDN4174999.1 cyclodeaminase/cyclohydrolase family protein [Nocardioides oceani]